MLQKHKHVSSLLLMGKNGSILENDEGMLATKIVSNGDARGSQKFITWQAETFSSTSANKAEFMPNSSHFIKRVSNGFCSFAENNKTFSGANFLDPIRIRCISADILQYLKTYSNTDKMRMKEQDFEYQKTALNRICSIMSRDCGNHKH